MFPSKTENLEKRNGMWRTTNNNNNHNHNHNSHNNRNETIGGSQWMNERIWDIWYSYYRLNLN